MGGYGGRPGAPPYGGNPYMPPQAGLGDDGPAPNTGLALGLAVAVTLCCCLPGGIYCIMQANQASTAVKMGDYAGAREKLKTTYIVMGICAVLGAIANIAYFALEFGNEF